MNSNSQSAFPTDSIPTAAEQAAEKERLAKQGQLEELFGRTTADIQADLEEAQAELMRELGVRERCFKKWIDEGKLSRIDARERFTRQKKALDIVNFLLDITGKHVQMTTDDVPF